MNAAYFVLSGLMLGISNTTVYFWITNRGISSHACIAVCVGCALTACLALAGIITTAPTARAEDGL